MAHDQRYPDTQWPTPVYNDFWRSWIWAITQPDWVNDLTENIRRNGKVWINKDAVAVLDIQWLLADANIWLFKSINWASAWYAIRWETVNSWAALWVYWEVWWFDWATWFWVRWMSSSIAQWAGKFINTIANWLAWYFQWRVAIGSSPFSPTTFLHIVSWVLSDSWLRLENLLFNQSAAVTNTTAVWVDNAWKVHIANSIGSADTRAINLQPQQTALWDTYEFKQSVSIWLPTGTWTYAWLETWRRYWFNWDFSWWPIYQYATTEDWNWNRVRFERNSTGATTWSAWRKINNNNFRTITATSTLTIWDDSIQVNNAAVNVTITLVSPVIAWAWAEIHISRWVWATWTITINPWAWQIEALANTLWATTSLAASWAYGQNVIFISNWTNWLRKMNW